VGITNKSRGIEENKNKIVFETLKNYKIGIAQIKATTAYRNLYEIVPEAGIFVFQKIKKT